MLGWLRMVALLVVAVGGNVTALGAGIALVADVVGDAVHNREPLKLLAELPANAELALAGDSQVVLFYLADGNEWTLKGPGRFRLAAQAPLAQKGAAVPRARVSAAAFQDLKLRPGRLAQGGVVMRGKGLLSPVREVVLGPDVRFIWESLGEGVVYQFELVDTTGQRLFQSETPDTEVRLPAGLQLTPGNEYYWSIRGRDAAGTQTFYRAAEFQMADTATRRRLESARPGPDAAVADRVLYAALLDGAGAHSAADALRRALAVERPVGWAPVRQ
jgi:hypothetical protein